MKGYVIIALAAIVGAFIGFAIPAPIVRTAAGACRTIDGDTINCGGERIRLNGIDAPEMAGHCRPGRDCAPGDPIASRISLANTLAGSPVRIERLKTDRYGRTVANVWIDYVGTNIHINASCEQLRRGQAIYKPQWDERGTTAEACGL